MKISNKFITVAGVVIIILVGLWWVTAVFIDNALSDIYQNAELQIAEQEVRVSNVAALTATASADEVVARIITDCAERGRFDTLLNKLSDNISFNELQELSRLFDRCASFYADRRAIMATRLDREVAVLAETVAFFTAIVGEAVPLVTDRVTRWQQVVEAELIIAGHFHELVVAQGEIIELLLQGKSRESTEIKTSLEKAQNARFQIAYQNKQIEQIRIHLELL